MCISCLGRIRGKAVASGLPGNRAREVAVTGGSCHLPPDGGRMHECSCLPVGLQVGCLPEGQEELSREPGGGGQNTRA